MLNPNRAVRLTSQARRYVSESSRRMMANRRKGVIIEAIKIKTPGALVGYEYLVRWDSGLTDPVLSQWLEEVK